MEQAGESTLADVALLGDACVDLSAVHPSGLAQLFAGRPTRLSNLVREPGALSVARRRARAAGARSQDFAQQLGVAPAYLAIGVATWDPPPVPEDPDSVPAGLAAQAPTSTRPPQAPVLLRPVALVPRGAGENDVELTLDASLEVNPVVARALRSAGALLDPVALARGAFSGGGFDPRPALERLRSLGEAVLPGFRLDERLLVGPFVHPGQALVDDLDALEPVLERHEVVVALAGDEATRTALRAPLPPAPTGDGDPRTERGVGDLDPAQRRVLDVLAAGHHLFVDTPPGSDGAAVAAAVVAEAAASGRSVLYVPGHRRSATALTGRLTALGLDDLLLDVAPDAAWRSATGARLLAGTTPQHVELDRASLDGLRAQLVTYRDQLADYMTAMHRVREPWGRSAYDALQALARLTAARPGPRTTVRLTPGIAHELSQERRTRIASDLERAAELGAFSLRPVDTPWFGAHLSTEGHAARALAALERLLGTAHLRAGGGSDQHRAAGRPGGPSGDAGGDDPGGGDERVRDEGVRDESAAHDGDLRRDVVPAELDDDPARRDDDAVRRLHGSLASLRRRMDAIGEDTGLVRATTVDQWGEQLAMLAGVRGALDLFQPMIFERSAADMVAATASRDWRTENGITMGFWLRRRLRRQAQDLVRPGRPVADLHGALVEVQRQREIWRTYCPAGGWPRLPEGLSDVEDQYVAVREDVELLERALADTPGGGGLAQLPLEELLARLRRLHEDRDALRTLPERTALLASLRGAGLGDLLVDLAHRRVPVDLVAAELELAWWSVVLEQLLAQDPALVAGDGARLAEVAESFRRLDRAHLAALADGVRAETVAALTHALAEHPHQAEGLFADLVEERFTGLREAWGRYPDVLPRIRPCVVASPMLVPQLLPATRVVDLVVIDAAGHVPLEHLLPALARARQVLVLGDVRCATGTGLPELAEALPRVALTADAARRDPHLTAFLAEHGYAGVLHPTPLPRTEALVRLDVVDGTGMPAPGQTAVASTQAEVEHVVRLVVEHARTRPQESLAVVSPSPMHVDRLREAVLMQVRDDLRHDADLARFFDPAAEEPFSVVDLGSLAGLRRDALLLTVGFGKTPHGRVLHQFGQLSEPGGEGLLLMALGATRGRLAVVSCFEASDLDPDRLRTPGSRLLADLLAFAAERTGATPAPIRPPGVDGEARGDRLLLDLAERLWRAGLRVELDHGLGDVRLPMVVGHPDLPDEMLVAVLTDDGGYVAEPSVRVRDRQALERLERLGWRVVQVWSAAVFTDPQREAQVIIDAVHEVLAARSAVG